MQVIISILFLFNYWQPSGHVNSKNGIGIQGYDPVTYFVSQKAVTGTREISSTYNDITYYFSSEENKQRFVNNPQDFLPQYGGWCAYAIGKSGDKVKIDPGTFKILDNKLYLFYNFRGYNTLNDWDKDEANLLSQADINWQQITK